MNYLDSYINYLLDRINTQKEQLSFINSILGQKELKQELEELKNEKGCD